MKQMLVFILFIIILTACAPSPEQINNRGNRSFNQQNYELALQDYLNAQVELPERAEPGYNAANTLEHQGDLQAAQQRLLGALETAGDELAQAIHYNLGNVLYQTQQYGLAVKSYQQALRLDPDDMDAKHNLELALQKQQEQAESEQTPSEQAQPETGQNESKEVTPSPAQPAAAEPLSPEQAQQLLEASGEQTQSLQQYLQQIFSSAGSPSEKDW